MNYSAIVEEGDSKRDLMYERFDRPADYGWVIAVHDLELRPNNLKHQHVMFSVWALYLEPIQGNEDMVGTGVRSCEVLINLDFVVLAGKLGHDELEGDVSAVRQKDF